MSLGEKLYFDLNADAGSVTSGVVITRADLFNLSSRLAVASNRK
jgi:hypothetical protein